MEYLTKIIENEAKNEGSQRALEDRLGLAHRYLTEVKAGRRGLPIEACFKLAEITGANLVRLIAESEAITAKKPEKVEFWKKKLESLTASIFFGLVILNMTITPAEAAPMFKSDCKTLYIMSNRRSKKEALKQAFLQAFKVFIPKSVGRFFVSRVDHMPA